MPRTWTSLLSLSLLLVTGARGTAGEPPARTTAVTLVHFNDVYEIEPVEGGRSGGLARVATVVSQLRRTHPALLTMLGGDYLSPSAIGTARVDGEPLAGRQMVAVLNAMGLDWATFGNHEFDVSEAAFRARLSESKFHLVSTNVTGPDGQPFPGVPTSAIVPITSAGRIIRLGFIGVTIDANRKPWVHYRDGIAAARDEVAKLRGQVDAIVALTHLRLTDDVDLVTAVPEIDVVLGGHEHENWLLRRGPRLVPIIKADANVRTVAVVTLAFGPPGSRPEVCSRLQPIDDTIEGAPAIETVARRWTTVAFDAFRRDGFSPESIVATTTEPLDGRESTVRDRPGRLTDIVTAGMAHEVKDADVALLNGGSVRIDDVVPTGPISEYDIIRILPFGGKVLRATLEGDLLARVLEAGDNNHGLGGYLHIWGARWEGKTWLVQGRPLDRAARYRVALPDFLLTGGEVNLSYLTRANPQVHDVREFHDIRRTTIDELRVAYPVKP
jgi:5'-nucleotidase/UDP-sugar diphosphatase